MALGLVQTRNPYDYYLDLLGQWQTNIALASQWFIYFNFDNLKRNGFFNSFENRLNNLEESKWKLNSNVTRQLTDGRLQHTANSLIGCIFAKQVSLPGENVQVSHSGLSYGGYQSPIVASHRGAYQNFSVTMIETNASFLDLIIRPWIISVGYNGLVARKKSSIKYVKADYVDMVMLAKAGQNKKLTIRKIYRFYNVAPIDIQGEDYSYAGDGMKYSSISFAYDKYSISDKNTGYYLGFD